MNAMESQKFPTSDIFAWLCGYIHQYMPITIKLGMEEYTMGLHLRVKCDPDQEWGVGTGAPKDQNLVIITVFSSFPELHTTSPLLFLSSLFFVPFLYL